MRHSIPPEKPRDLPPKAVRLRELGRQALGEGWQYRLAQAEGVALKTVQRWATGERECPDYMLTSVEGMLRKFQISRVPRLLEEIEKAASDVEAFVVSAHLTDLAQRLKPSSEAPKDRRYKPKSTES